MKGIKQARVRADYTEIAGSIKPMHGVGQPPMTGVSNTKFYYLTRAGIPFSRLHDVGGWMGSGLYVDIPNLFPNFDADEYDPASYEFAYTDRIIKGLVDAGCAPYFRLGVTIENEHRMKAYRIFPPKDFSKWARICEQVIRHYNEGWADGFRFGITYWEIWNEPDDCYKDRTAAMWKGTPEEYFELYSVTARHLKTCFGDAIKVGGYGHCGVYEYAQDDKLEGIRKEECRLYEFTINFFHDFLKYQRATDAPMDFFSWHVYDNCHPSTFDDFLVIREHAAYVRRVLDHYGYTEAEHHLNEWNLWTYAERRDEPRGAAKTLAFMLMMQNTSTDVMCYYDGRMGNSAYSGLFNPDKGTPYRSYYSMMMFNSLYRLGNSVVAECDDARLFAHAAVKGRRAALVLANTADEPLSVSLDLLGFPMDDVEIFRIDEEHRYTLTGEDLATASITLPPYSCAEIRLVDLT